MQHVHSNLINLVSSRYMNPRFLYYTKSVFCCKCANVNVIKFLIIRIMFYINYFQNNQLMTIT